jgi:isopentenyl diphosphate isomerase/L-lactate dehydrogenase-like FMN-dependent dehydrogenase
MLLRETTRSVSPARSCLCRVEKDQADTAAKIANADVYRKVLFRPRILRKIAKADASTTILGKPSTIPVFISPAYVFRPDTATRAL